MLICAEPAFQRFLARHSARTFYAIVVSATGERKMCVRKKCVFEWKCATYVDQNTPRAKTPEYSHDSISRWMRKVHKKISWNRKLRCLALAQCINIMERFIAHYDAQNLSALFSKWNVGRRISSSSERFKCSMRKIYRFASSFSC